MDILVILVAVAILVFTTISLGMKIVPQGDKFVVQRLGKYHSTLNPGLNFIIPFVDNIAYRVTTKDIVLDIPSQEVITRDNVVIIANAIAYINIAIPEKAVYGVEDYRLAIQGLIQTSLRSIVGEMDLDAALSSRDQIKASLTNSISDDIADWGIVVKTVEIQDINPSPTMQAAMEEQAAAERSRRAAVTKAEGDKRAVILESEGELEAARNEAEAKLVLAEASGKAIKEVAAAMQEQELPVLYLLGERYIDNLAKVSASDNAKTIILPADLPGAIKGMLGGFSAFSAK